MQDTPELLLRLLEAGVEFIVVGGMAAAIHGSTRNTDDLDVAAPFTRQNMERLLAALTPLRPRNAARPDLGTISASPDELSRYRNLYLTTDKGRLDILGEVPPLGGYAEVDAEAEKIPFLGRTCKVIGLDQLITIKESIGRPKDRETAVELKAIRDRLRGRPQSAS